MYISVYICSIYIYINIGGITFHSFNNKQLLYMITFIFNIFYTQSFLVFLLLSLIHLFLNFFFFCYYFFVARRHFWSFSRLNSLNIYNIIQSYTILYSPLHQIFINANTILISNILLLNLLIKSCTVL